MNFLKKISFCCGISFLAMFILVFISTIFNFFNIFGVKIMNFLYMFIPIVSCFIGGISLRNSIFYLIIIATCVLGSMIGINKKKED